MRRMAGSLVGWGRFADLIIPHAAYRSKRSPAARSPRSSRSWLRLRHKADRAADGGRAEAAETPVLTLEELRIRREIGNPARVFLK